MKYSVKLARTCIEYTTVEIEADSENQAIEFAENKADRDQSLDWELGSDKESCWCVDIEGTDE